MTTNVSPNNPWKMRVSLPVADACVISFHHHAICDGEFGEVLRCERPA